MKRLLFLRSHKSSGLVRLVRELRSSEIGVLRTRRIGSTCTGRGSDLIINWGSTNRKRISHGYKILNEPDKVALAVNKLVTFEHLRECIPENIPEFTTSKEVANSWLCGDTIVYARELLIASGGRGIVLFREGDYITPAPLYTRGIKIKKEFRVHVFCGKVIDFTQKKLLSPESREERNIEVVSTNIRNLKGGWIFARRGVTLPIGSEGLSIRAVSCLDLDFGAVDMVLSEDDKLYIIEVNTAPGLQGTAVLKYSEAIRDEML